MVSNGIFVSMALWTMLNLLLTTALPTIDRYVVVKYTLRNELITTKYKLFVTLASIWAIRVAIAGTS